MTASSVYIHVPFCEAKCPYCAFASEVPSAGDGTLFLDSLKEELSFRRRSLGRVKTLYIGGGTPTFLAPPLWERLTALLESSLAFEADAEVTVEANPNSLSAGHLSIWRDWRVTRTSVGVQSLDDAELFLLGRRHDRSRALDAIAACRARGFSVSVDLMFGLPYGTLQNWARTLRETVAMRPHHLSIYQLSIEPGTPFAEASPDGLQDGYAPYRYAQWFLSHKGYEQYEVASFALPGNESRHNLNYWEDGEYVGLGPSAWGSLGGVRYRNARTLSDYVALVREGSPTVFEERLGRERAARQAAVLALRTTRGIVWKIFEARHGHRVGAKLREELERFPSRLVRCDATGASLTPSGLRVGNAIWSEIV